MSDAIPQGTGEIRNDKGQFVPGVSGNPNGRPPGTVSIVEAIRRKLKEIPAGDERTWLDKFLTTLFEEAIDKKNDKLLRDIIDRVDGKATQPVAVDGEIRHPLYLPGELIRKNELPSGPSEDSGGPTPVSGS